MPRGRIPKPKVLNSLRGDPGKTRRNTREPDSPKGWPEPVGEEAGWVTARFFESLGCQLATFTDVDYAEAVMPRDHPLWVSSGEELAEKILSRSYEECVRLQSGLIDPAWLNWRGWYYLPFQDRLRE